MDINDTLRQELARARQSSSLLQISRESGVPYASLHDYLESDKGLHSRHIASLATFLGFELRKVRRKK